MNHQLLKIELEKTENAELSDAQIVEALNEASIEYHEPVSTLDIHSHLMETPSALLPPFSLYNVLSRTYRNANYPEIVQAIAENVIDLCTAAERKLALHENPTYALAFGALAQAGRYTQSEVDSIINLGKRLHSRAEIELGGAVSEQDIRIARLSDKAAFARQKAAIWSAAAGELESGTDVALGAGA